MTRSPLLRTAFAALASLLALSGVAARAESVPIGRYVELPLDDVVRHPHPMTGGDVRRTARSSARAPAARPALVWSRQLEQRRLVPPAVLADGSLLVAGSAGVERHGPGGERDWIARVGAVRFTPIVLRDRSAVVATEAGDLLLIDPSGNSRALVSGRKLVGMPLLLSDDLLAVPAVDGQVHVVDRDGSPRMVVPTVQERAGRTARVADGLLAVAGGGGALSLLSLHAGRERNVPLPQPVVAGPVVGTDGLIWLVGRDGTLWGVTPSGTVRFELAIGEAPTRSQPALGKDGALRVATGGGTLVCVSPQGKELWRRGVDGRMGAITLDADDTALFTTSRGSLYAIDAAGELRWRLDMAERGLGRPVLGADGTLYLVSAGGRIHALR